jgi:hypothetical protein
MWDALADLTNFLSVDRLIEAKVCLQEIPMEQSAFVPAVGAMRDEGGDGVGWDRAEGEE